MKSQYKLCLIYFNCAQALKQSKLPATYAQFHLKNSTFTPYTDWVLPQFSGFDF